MRKLGEENFNNPMIHRMEDRNIFKFFCYVRFLITLGGGQNYT